MQIQNPKHISLTDMNMEESVNLKIYRLAQDNWNNLTVTNERSIKNTNAMILQMALKLLYPMRFWIGPSIC